MSVCHTNLTGELAWVSKMFPPIHLLAAQMTHFGVIERMSRQDLEYTRNGYAVIDHDYIRSIHGPLAYVFSPSSDRHCRQNRRDYPVSAQMGSGREEL